MPLTWLLLPSILCCSYFLCVTAPLLANNKACNASAHCKKKYDDWNSDHSSENTAPKPTIAVSGACLIVVVACGG